MDYGQTLYIHHHWIEATILGIVRDQLAEILEKSPDEIAEDVPFTDLGADSLALIELVEALEESLATYSAGFHIDDEDLEGLLSGPRRGRLRRRQAAGDLTRLVSLLLSPLDALAERVGLARDESSCSSSP